METPTSTPEATPTPLLGAIGLGARTPAAERFDSRRVAEAVDHQLSAIRDILLAAQPTGRLATAE